MLRVLSFVLFLLALFLVSACDLSGQSAPSNAEPEDILVRKAEVDAQAAVIRAEQTRVASVARAASLRADQTREARAANALSTSQAIDVAQKRVLAQTTVDTAVMAVTLKAMDVKATAETRELQQAKAKQETVATAQFIISQQRQAERDAEIARENAEFYVWVNRITIVGLLLIVAFIGLRVAQVWLDGRMARNQFIETRSGTMMIVATSSGYTAQPVSQLQLPPGDNFNESDAPTATNEAPLLRVNHNGRAQYIEREDPQAKARAAARQRAMRLLRAAITQVGGNSTRIPTAADLGWNSETWVRAVSSLKPFVATKEGRAGGTWCNDDRFPTILQLYNAVGERKITLSPVESQVSEMG